jgi:hypothetical protein
VPVKHVDWRIRTWHHVKLWLVTIHCCFLHCIIALQQVFL